MSDQPHWRVASPAPLVRFDGGPEPDAASVAALRAELRKLPELEAPAHIWDDVQARSLPAAAPHRRRRLVSIALAASVFAVAATAVFMAHAPDRETADVDIAALFERSRAAEAARRATPVVFASGPSDVERVLRVRIGGLDASLNDQLLRGANPDSRQALLRERVELMENLTTIERYRHSELVRQAVY